MDDHPGKRMIITPALAADFLSKLRPEKQRRLRPSRVRQYAADMAAGRFTRNSDAICFHLDGWLANGQHRLRAIVATGVSLNMKVEWEYTDEEVRNIDRGIIRPLNDRLRIAGGLIYSRDSVARAKVIVDLVDVTRRPDVDERAKSVIDAFSEEMRWGSEELSFSSSFRTAPFAAVMIVAYAMDSDKTADLLNKLRNPVGLTSGCPSIVLRDMVFRGCKGGRNERLTVATKMARAIEAFHHGERLTKLYASDSGRAWLAAEVVRRIGK